MARLRSLMRDEPISPLERAVWWTEYVLRHGGAKHLRSPAANMPWIEFLELELLAYVLLSLSLSLAGFVFVICSLWRFINQYKTNIKVKSN